MPTLPVTRKRAGALPNLIIIGAMKCGTSSLHRYLDLHPEIAMSPLKEPNYFLPAHLPFSTSERGIDWYRSLFDPDARVRGEASVNYSMLPGTAGTAENIASTVGSQVQLIYMVRDPLERAISHYIHARAAAREQRSAEDALGDFESRYVRRSLYATQLEPFLRHFGPERVHVESQEDLLALREETLRRVFGFLGVERDFTSPQFERLWEVSAGKSRRFTLAYQLTRRLGGPERWGALPPRLRWLGERVAFSGRGAAPRPAISDELASRLRELFRPEAEQLRELSGLGFEQWSV